MDRHMDKLNTLAKILLAALAGVVIRVVGVLVVPASEQTILQPSRFAEAGALPWLTGLYALVGYAVVAGFFLIVGPRISGAKYMQGLKYGGSLAVIAAVFAFEPLPHLAQTDYFVNAAVAGLAIFAVGFAVAMLLGDEVNEIRYYRTIFHIIPTNAVAVLFFIGRMIQYYALDIYSEASGQRMIWTAVAGLTLAAVMNWYHNKRPMHSRVLKVLLLAVVVLGWNILLHYLYLPLVYRVDIVDLFTRAGIDILAVALAVLLYMPNGDGREPEIIVPKRYGFEETSQGSPNNEPEDASS